MPTFSVVSLAVSRNVFASAGVADAADVVPFEQLSAAAQAAAIESSESVRPVMLLSLSPPRRTRKDGRGALARADVHVGAEEVVGIVFRFQIAELRIVRPVNDGRRIAWLIVLQVVHVARLCEVRRQRRVGLPRPRDVPL